MKTYLSYFYVSMWLFFLYNYVKPIALDIYEYFNYLYYLIKHKHHHADEQDQNLHRDFDEGAHQQRRAAFADRFSRQKALHLALIATEIRQHQKQSANQSGPQRVSFVQVEAGIHGFHSPDGSG